MSHKEIRLYDDSVIKLTVKQGLESERFPASNISENGSAIFNSDPINILNFTDVTSISGSFVSGELAYTRDTNRLFVGNISEKLNGDQQQTLGGTISGNKYLGYIDSRKNYTESDNGTPYALSGTNGLLLESSPYRSYNFTNVENNEIKQTEDKKWQRLSFYNEKYDAYDGDIMYDIYRNALILFDHNIKPEDGTTAGTATIGGKRKTPLMARFSDEDVDNISAKSIVKQYTSDMYGDGYVLLYNVVPDGDTLTFAPRSFDENGIYNNKDEAAANYSQNIIKINKVPSPAIIDALDPDLFGFSETGSGKITIKTNNLPGNNDIEFDIQEPDKSYILVNQNNVITQSSKSISDIEKLNGNIRSLSTEIASLNAKTGQIDTNTGNINSLNTRITSIEQTLGGDKDPSESMTPGYMLKESLTLSNGSVTIQPNYEEPGEGETEGAYLGNYYIIVKATGTFTITESLTIDLDAEEGDTETTKTEVTTMNFGSEPQRVTIGGQNVSIPVRSEIMIPLNGQATYVIAGPDISEVIKVPVI